ncbi:MAG TPA: AarF/UbiB family protein [Planctomycetota bacterium]|nr:AarF/UbiB family protein [Planctomycetota bacterium]
MALSFKPQHLKVYKDIALLLWKYGRSDLVKKSGLDSALNGHEEPASPEKAAEASQLTDDLEKLGPTYIKFGQLLSTRPDLIPAAYTTALERLQDKVEPFPFADAERIIAEELGVRLSRGFQEIEPRPAAAASLGQVHRATLRDGRVVAVKVQRPGIRERMTQDLDVIAEMAEFLDDHTDAGRRADFSSIVAEFRKMLLRELDYTQEAQNLQTLHENLKDFPNLVVPRPIEDYSSSRVLTMEYVSGAKIASLSPVVRLEADGENLAEELFRAYLQQILVDGFFHADPHPGNVFMTPDKKLALLDLGMAARLPSDFQEDLCPMVLDLAEGRNEGALMFARKHGVKLQDYDEKEFSRRIGELVARNRSAMLNKAHIGAQILEVRAIAADCALRLPPELALIGKTLLNLDNIGSTLAPTFDPAAAVRRNSATLMKDHLLKSLSPGNVFARFMELKDFAQRLPARVNRIMDMVADNELQVAVNAMDEKYLMTGMQKVANRITLGLILAAMIIGAALLMRIETRFQLFGYPGLPIIFFLLAAVGGCVLGYQILFHDEYKPKKETDPEYRKGSG